MYTPEGHRARAKELLADADKEPRSDYKVVLMQAAGVHFEHARTLEEDEDVGD